MAVLAILAESSGRSVFADTFISDVLVSTEIEKTLF